MITKTDFTGAWEKFITETAAARHPRSCAWCKKSLDVYSAVMRLLFPKWIEKHETHGICLRCKQEQLARIGKAEKGGSLIERFKSFSNRTKTATQTAHHHQTPETAAEKR